MTISIVIPVYNEKDTILKVIEKLENLNFKDLEFEKEIIIVDDNSDDGTRKILKQLEEDYKVFYHSENKGKGAALHTGFREANGDYIVVQDADLEYEPEDILELLKVALENPEAIIYGSRNLQDNPQSSWLYKKGGELITSFFNLFFSEDLSDLNTCYKLFPVEVLEDMSLSEEGFAFCEEFTCQAVKNSYKIREVPISYNPRSLSQGKKIRWWHGFKSLFVILKNKLAN